MYRFLFGLGYFDNHNGLSATFCTICTAYCNISGDVSGRQLARLTSSPCCTILWLTGDDIFRSLVATIVQQHLQCLSSCELQDSSQSAQPILGYHGAHIKPPVFLQQLQPTFYQDAMHGDDIDGDLNLGRGVQPALLYQPPSSVLIGCKLWALLV